MHNSSTQRYRIYLVDLPCKSEGQLGGEKLTGSGRYDREIQFPGGGKSGPQILGKKLGISLRIPRIDLEIRRKSTISDGNPDDSTETLRKSLIAVLRGELTGRGKYQPEIQFPEGENYLGGVNQLDVYDITCYSLIRREC